MRTRGGTWVQKLYYVEDTGRYAFDRSGIYCSGCDSRVDVISAYCPACGQYNGKSLLTEKLTMPANSANIEQLKEHVARLEARIDLLEEQLHAKTLIEAEEDSHD